MAMWMNASAGYTRLVTILVIICASAFSCSPVSKRSDQPLYAGLLNDNAQSQKVSPGMTVHLPQDHGAHPLYAIEWWYLTANLFDQDGQQYPLQWTLFRFRSGASKSTWHDGNLYMAHGKLMTKQDTWFAERFARGGVGNAGVGFDSSDKNFSAFLDDWQWQARGADLLPATLKLSLPDGVSVKLSLTSTKPYILHGEHGYSVKQQGSEHASMYYSQPFIELKGSLTLPERTVEVSGTGWFDHEWSARLSDQQTLGWDWFSLHLDDGNKLMMFRVRQSSATDSWFGTHVSAQGIATPLRPDDINAAVLKVTSIANQELPLDWTLSLPKFDISITVVPFKTDQFNRGRFSYYEGAVMVSGSHSGVGFIELTGY